MYLSNKINLIKIYFKPFVYIAIVNQRRVRGITRGVCIEKVRKVGKIKVDISDDHTGGSGDSAAWLASYVGTLTRTYAPMATSSWAKVPQDVKDHIKNRCLVISYFV